MHSHSLQRTSWPADLKNPHPLFSSLTNHPTYLLLPALRTAELTRNQNPFNLLMRLIIQDRSPFSPESLWWFVIICLSVRLPSQYSFCSLQILFLLKCDTSAPPPENIEHHFSTNEVSAEAGYKRKEFRVNTCVSLQNLKNKVACY